MALLPGNRSPAHWLSRTDRQAQMTATACELLRALSPNAGRVSIHEPLLRRVWGGRHDGDTEPVRTFVKKLRRRLGDDAASPAGQSAANDNEPIYGTEYANLV